MPLNHFIAPQVIDIDNVNARVEALADITTIDVHAIYKSEKPIEIALNNTTPLDDNAIYHVQDYSGNDLTAEEIASILHQPLRHMKHVDMSGTVMVDADLSGANISTINSGLTGLLYPTAGEDTSGNFRILEEVYKTLSSYLTNHTALSLADSMKTTNHNDQLNAGLAIGTELVGFKNIANDASGNDTIPYLNTFLDNNNGNQVFGGEAGSCKMLVFIVKSATTLQRDVSTGFGVVADQLSAISSVVNKTEFQDDFNNGSLNRLGEQNQVGTVSGDYYAALCFPLVAAV